MGEKIAVVGVEKLIFRIGEPIHPAISIPDPSEKKVYQDFGQIIFTLSGQPFANLSPQTKQRIDQEFQTMKETQKVA